MNSKLKHAVNLAKKHVGHKVTYMLGGVKKEGIIARLSIDPKINEVVLWIENKPYFPTKIFLNSIYDCECIKKE